MIDRMQQFVVVFLIPIFLAVSGLQTNLRVLDTVALGGIALFLAAMVVGEVAGRRGRRPLGRAELATQTRSGR